MYDRKQMERDLFNAMQSRQGYYSGRALGNSENVKLWDTAKLDSLWEGIVTARARFFRSELSLRDFARLIICEGMQESTGDWNAGCKAVDFEDHTAHGFIQVTPGSVMKDFSEWGQSVTSALKARRHVTLLDPANTLSMDTSDPCTTILMFAWYTKNSVNMGMSFNEYAHRHAWNISLTPHSKVYGACQAVWLGGPRTYIDSDAGWKAYDDYYKRILDYYTQSGFGSKQDFDKLVLQTALVDEVVYVAPAVKAGT